MNPNKPVVCIALCLIYSLYLSSDQVSACRVSSERLKQHARKTIDHLLDVAALKSFYWQDEPIAFESLSKITGLNITSAETHFNSSRWEDKSQTMSNTKVSMLDDIFVTCSAGPDRSYTLTINLEVKNAFDSIDLSFKPSQKVGNVENGLFRLILPQSTFSVQLNQLIRYDECFDLNFVQLGSNMDYSIDCSTCDETQTSNLNKLINKKMAQLDAELDLLLSDKFTLGLQYLLSQQRLDLDLYLN